MISRLNDGLNDDFNDFLWWRRSETRILSLCLYEFGVSDSVIYHSNLSNARQGPGSYHCSGLHTELMGPLSCCMLRFRIFARLSILLTLILSLTR
jgi:hypothetical protein